jgi:hypothetical protein
MSMKALFRLTLIVFSLCLAGCGNIKSPTEPLDEPRGPAFTFSQVQGRIFTPNCVKSGCHDAATASGDMVLAEGQAYGNIVNHPAAGNNLFNRIEPGNPERSYMIKKLRGDADITGAQMPFDAPGTLTKEQMDGLIGWILAGAPNN